MGRPRHQERCSPRNLIDSGHPIARRGVHAVAHSRWPSLVTLGYGLTGDRGLAEDLAQTTLVSAYASWPRVRKADDPDALRWPDRVRPYRVGAASFVVLTGAGKSVTRWIAYSAVGERLGSGLFYN